MPVRTGPARPPLGFFGGLVLTVVIGYVLLSGSGGSSTFRVDRFLLEGVVPFCVAPLVVGLFLRLAGDALNR